MLNDFLHLIFPETCISCEEVLPSQRKHLCDACERLLPVVDGSQDLPFRKLAGRVPLSYAFSYLKFNKSGVVQKLLHELKYKNSPELGIYLGSLFAQYMVSSQLSYPVDVVVPVPLHPKRLKERGYNQAEAIAKGLIQSTVVQLDTSSLIRTKDNLTQTKKGRTARLTNMLDCFALHSGTNLKGKRVGIVDDVITTGATLEACCVCLEKAEVKEISVFSLAVA